MSMHARLTHDLGQSRADGDVLKTEIILDALAAGQAEADTPAPTEFTDPGDNALVAAIRSILTRQQLHSSYKAKRTCEVLEAYLVDGGN